MPKNSLVGEKGSLAAAAKEKHLDRLVAMMDGHINTSDIPEVRANAVRVKRDAAGRLPVRRKSPIRDAILAALERHQMTRYALWKKAKTQCPRLPQSAVYEYLRGGRDIGAPYLEALFAAAGLRATSTPARRTPKTKKTGTSRRPTSKLVTS